MSKYKINQDVLEGIDKETVCYFIGFMYADGNNFPEAAKITINLANTDREILEKIRTILSSDHPIREIKRTGGKRKDQVSLSFSNPTISKALEKLGVVKNKTKILKFPDWLTEDMYPHFIRGYFDGDGCLLIDRNKYLQFNIVGTENLLLGFKKIFEEKLGVKVKTLKDPSIYKNNPCSIKYLSYSSLSAKNIMEYLYKDSSVYLKRKHKIFTDYINNIKN